MANTWRVWSGGDNSAGTSKATAYHNVGQLLSAQTIGDGDIILCHKTHAGVGVAAGNGTAAGIVYTLPEGTAAGAVAIIAVDMDASDALTSTQTDTDLPTEETGGNFGLQINGSTNSSLIYLQGMVFKAGSGTTGSSATIQFEQSSGNYCRIVANDCVFWVNSTLTTGPSIMISSTGSGSSCNNEFWNCRFRFGHTSAFINPGRGSHKFYNCSLHASSTAPAALFKQASASPQSGLVECIGCNWSGATTLVDVSQAGTFNYRFRHCATASTTLTTGTHPGFDGPTVEAIVTGPVDGTNGPDVLAYFWIGPPGKVESTTGVYLTTGGSQGTEDDGTTTPWSFKLTPTSYCSRYSGLTTPWIPIKVSTVGSKTITMKVAHTESAVLKDAEIEIQVAYMGGANLTNSPAMQFAGSAPVVGSTIVRDAYVAGSDLTDHGSGGDNADPWTNLAEKAHTLTKTVTVDYAGYLMARVVVYKATTNPVYADGKVNLS